MKYKVLIIISCMFFTYCSHPKKSQAIGNSDYRMTIIDNNEYIKWLTGKEYKMWVPDEKELIKIDILLQKALNDNKFPFLKSAVLTELKSRYRQYLCYIDHEGNKIIYINSFCEVPITYDDYNNSKPLDWKNEVVDIADGGSCYWKMKLNITKNYYYDLIINDES